MNSKRPGSEPVTHDQLAEALAVQASDYGRWLKAEVDRIMHAFPDGVDAHRSAHEAMIKAAQAQEEFWRGLRVDMAKKSLWAILQILLFLIAAGVAAKLGITIPVRGE